MGVEGVSRVGQKYQMVLDRQARRQLGVQPGWIAVQTVAGDHLEVRFLPPEHGESQAGRLKRYARPASPDLAAERNAAWAAETGSRWGRA